MNQSNIIPCEKGNYTVSPNKTYFVCDQFFALGRVMGSEILEREEDFVNVHNGVITPVDVKGKKIKCVMADGYNLDLTLNKHGELFAEIYDGEELIKSGFTGIIFLDETYCVELHSCNLYLYSGSYIDYMFYVQLSGKNYNEGYDYFMNVLYGFNPLAPKKYDADSEVDMECIDFNSSKVKSALKRKAVVGGIEELKPFLQAGELLFETNLNALYNLAIIDSYHQVTYKFDGDFSRFSDSYNSDEYSNSSFQAMNRGYKILGENTILVSIQSAESEGCMVYILYHEGMVFLSTNMFVWDKYVADSNNVTLVKADLSDDYDGVRDMEKVNFALSSVYLYEVDKAEFMHAINYLPMMVNLQLLGITSMMHFDLSVGLEELGVSLNCKIGHGSAKVLRNLEFPMLKGQRLQL